MHKPLALCEVAEGAYRTQIGSNRTGGAHPPCRCLTRPQKRGPATHVVLTQLAQQAMMTVLVQILLEVAQGALMPFQRLGEPSAGSEVLQIPQDASLDGLHQANWLVSLTTLGDGRWKRRGGLCRCICVLSLALREGLQREPFWEGLRGRIASTIRLSNRSPFVWPRGGPGE